MLAELFGEACIDCGKKDPVRGDLKYQSPSFTTSEIRKENNRHGEESKQDEIPEIFYKHFRPGSKHSKGK